MRQTEHQHRDAHLTLQDVDDGDRPAAMEQCRALAERRSARGDSETDQRMGAGHLRGARTRLPSKPQADLRWTMSPEMSGERLRDRAGILVDGKADRDLRRRT